MSVSSTTKTEPRTTRKVTPGRRAGAIAWTRS